MSRNRDTRNMRTLRQAVQAHQRADYRQRSATFEKVVTAADAVLAERGTVVTPNTRAAVMSEAEGEEA